MTYAIIRSGGKQYKVQPGDVLEVEQLSAKPNEKHVFSEVLLFASDGSTKFGNPLVSGVSVEAIVIGNVKGEKIRVSKFKAKSKYRRTTGHRQHLTQVQIASVGNVKAEAKSQKTELESTKEVKTESKASVKTIAEKKPAAKRATKKSATK